MITKSNGFITVPFLKIGCISVVPLSCPYYRNDLSCKYIYLRTTTQSRDINRVGIPIPRPGVRRHIVAANIRPTTM